MGGDRHEKKRVRWRGLAEKPELTDFEIQRFVPSKREMAATHASQLCLH
jgi:hypothetical protein